jgi:alpha-beta hydrolase superfamily lysophospholipase
VDAYAADPLCGFICSYGFFRDLFAGFDLVYGASGLIGSIPPSLAFYVAAGAEDPMGGARGAVGKLERRLRAAGSGRVTTRLYPGARHELLKETNRDEAIGDIVAWLEGALEPEVAAPGVGAAEPARPRG